MSLSALRWVRLPLLGMLLAVMLPAWPTSQVTPKQSSLRSQEDENRRQRLAEPRSGYAIIARYVTASTVTKRAPNRLAI